MRLDAMLPSADAVRTVGNLRKATRKFAEAEGIEVGGGLDGRFPKKPQTATYDRLQDALLTGDSATAQQLVDGYVRRFGEADPVKALKSLKGTVSARQPLKVGAHRGENVKTDFFNWASTHLSADRFAEFMALQQRYEDTARSVGLMQ